MVRILDACFCEAVDGQGSWCKLVVGESSKEPSSCSRQMAGEWEGLRNRQKIFSRKRCRHTACLRPSSCSWGAGFG